MIVCTMSYNHKEYTYCFSYVNKSDSRYWHTFFLLSAKHPESDWLN